MIDFFLKLREGFFLKSGGPFFLNTLKNNLRKIIIKYDLLSQGTKLLILEKKIKNISHN
jgi:hypothetical protein